VDRNSAGIKRGSQIQEEISKSSKYSARQSPTA